MTTDLFPYSNYSVTILPAKYQTGYSVVSCCALTVTVVTVHCNVLNAYDDECVHSCTTIYAYVNNLLAGLVITALKSA